jgi:manganese/iron transport system permease protein
MMFLNELFSDPYVLRALAVAAVAALLCAVVGVYVVVRGISFAGDGLSHASLAGAGFARLMAIPPLWGAVGYACFLSALISRLGGGGKLREDARLAVLFTGSMAVGFVLLSKQPGGALTGALFGSLLPLGVNDVVVISAAAVLLLVSVKALQKELLLVAVDEEFAAVTGVGPSRYLLVMDLAIAFTVVIASKAVGVLLVSSLLVVPPSIALVAVRDIGQAFSVSAGIGVAVSLIGVVLSVLLDTPPGATIALVSAVVFIIFMAAHRFRGRRW